MYVHLDEHPKELLSVLHLDCPVDHKMELVSTYCTMCDYAKTQSKGYVMSSWYALRACPKNLETSLALEILN